MTVASSIQRLTNSQAADHESWMVRYSPCAPGFSRKQFAVHCFEAVLKSIMKVNKLEKTLSQGDERNGQISFCFVCM